MLHDFKMIDVKDIAFFRSVFDTCLWEPLPSDKEKELLFISISLRKFLELGYMVMGNVNQDSRILVGRIPFSNGYSVETGPLEHNGQALDVQINPQSDIEWVSFQVLKMEGPHPGLTEWEIFNQPQPDVHVFKILVNGEFAYHWDVYPGETVEVGLYSYPEDEPVTWKLNGTAISLEQLNRRISEESGTAVIQVISLKTGDILDEIYIHKASGIDKFHACVTHSHNRLRMWVDKQKIKRRHHQLRVLKWESLKK